MSNVPDLKKQWLKEPEFKAAYEGMADEFELASAVIEARTIAGLTQEELTSEACWLARRNNHEQGRRKRNSGCY